MPKGKILKKPPSHWEASAIPTASLASAGGMSKPLFPTTYIDFCRCACANVKSGSTPVGGPVKSGQSRMKEESRGLYKRLVQPELVTAWIQRLRITSVDPLRRFQSRGEDRDRDGDRQEQE